MLILLCINIIINKIYEYNLIHVIYTNIYEKMNQKQFLKFINFINFF